jgi:ATP-dependent DNA helicase PIF1
MSRKRLHSEDEDVFGDKIWSASQCRVLESVLKRGKRVFITGAGGVGKSEVIKRIVHVMKTRGLKVGVTAHTGIAAITIGGQTLFSFMHFTPSRIEKTKEEVGAEILKNKYWCDTFKSYRCLIIDEISMVDPHIFEMMDHVLQVARRDFRPFGGIQLILVGDFFQLPSPDRKMVQKYVFQSKVFWDVMEGLVTLSMIIGILAGICFLFGYFWYRT